mmetsp:Transcript_49639/g.63622  ORF Transcript_49639/g.63622 Transcript_49639/m.63622 type:complete len:425 (-) Transcript_49639:349-1623(-)
MKKRSRREKDTHSDDDNDNKKKKSDNGGGGNAYDSGDEVVANEGDKSFLDSDDDLADIAKEYDEETQNFNDEQDDEFDKRTNEDREDSSSGRLDEKAFKQMVNGGKKKAKDMEATDKLVIISNLLEHMEDAWRKDIECLNAKPYPKPAIHKLSILDKISKIIGQRNLHDTLLDEGILEKIRNWLYPYPYEDSNGNELPLSKRTLPNLTLRSKLYELLLLMPITPEHLKHTEGGGYNGNWQGLGKVILMLLKHPNETSEQKRCLSHLLEEWSRQIFKKTKDFKHLKTTLRESNKVYKPNSSSSSNSSSSLRRTSSEAIDDLGSTSPSSSASLRKKSSSSLLLGDKPLPIGEVIPDLDDEFKTRASRPFRIGFDYKVQPMQVEIKAAKIGKNQAKKNALMVKLKTQQNLVKQGSQRGVAPSSRVDL